MPTLRMAWFIGRASFARVLVGHAQEQREDDEVGDERRAAVRHERQRDAGERDHPRDAADDDERLEAEDRGEARGEELRERAGRLDRDAEPAPDDEQEADDERDRADEAELLADGGEDEVGRRVGDAIGDAEADALAVDAAGGEGVPRLDDLEALRAEPVRPRVEPALHAVAHVAEHVVRRRRAGGEQRERTEEVRAALGGHVEHRREHREEQQRRAEVALEDEHQDRDAPGGDQRTEVARGRKPEPARRCAIPPRAARASA